MWSLGCVFSLALVWSVLGPKKLKIYQRSLEKATNEIPVMKDSAYVGCFHDGVKALKEVHSMHNQVIQACGRSDNIIHELVPIISDMLDEDPRKRPSAKKVRQKCRMAFDWASRLSVTESNIISTSNAGTAKSQTPLGVPQNIDYSQLEDSHYLTDVVENPSTMKSTSVPQGSDVVIIDQAVSSTAKTNSNWKDAESSMYEPLPQARQLDSSDTATTYSLNSSIGDSDTDYFRAFAEELAEDLRVDTNSTKVADVPSSYIRETLRMFTWKLHEESNNPFQWGISVTLNQKREYVVQFHFPRFHLREYPED
jgi:serine/threonine protein kinase